MSLRPKTKRRLLIILSVCGVVVGGLVFAQRARQQKEAARVEGLRVAGIAAHDRGEYAPGLTQLSDYLSAVKVDQHEPGDGELDALYAFADSRWRIRADDSGKHLVEARDLLERYLRSRSADEKARRLILDLNARTNRHREVIAVANDILQSAPDDREALLAKARAMRMTQPKPDLAQCRETVDKLLKVDPANLNGLLLSLDLKLADGKPPDAVVDQAAAWAKAHPEQPAYHLALARTCLMLARNAANPTAKSTPAGAPTVGPASAPSADRQLAWLEQAKAAALAAADAPAAVAEPAVAIQLTATLEKTGQFARALAYARSAADRLPGAELDRELVRRLWQTGANDEVLARTAKLDLGSPAADTYLLGFRALALTVEAIRTSNPAGSPSTSPATAPTASASTAADRTRRLNDADAIATALAARAQELDAQAWATLLQTEAHARPTASAKPLTATEQLARYREANAKDRGNMVVVARLGDALAAVGEGEPAVAAWADAGERWEWAQPFARIAVRRLQDGRVGDAERAAYLAHVRQPESRPFEALWLQARFAGLGRPGPSAATRPSPAAEKLLADVRAFEQKAPNDADTLRVEVALVGRVEGSAAAADRVRAALAATPPLPLDALMQLLAVDRAEKLGTAGAIEAAVAGREGGASKVALRRAAELIDQGKPQEAVSSLTAAEVAQPTLATDAGWLLSAAGLRDRANDPSAAAAVAAVADKFPQDPAVQAGVLNVSALRRDRELWRRTIDRLKALTGDDGTVWKVERAQWLLAANAGATERKEATDLLSQVAKRNRGSFDARRLLGRALLADGQYARAAEELVAATAIRPDQVPASLELFAAHRLAKQNNESVAVLNRLSAMAALPADQRQRVAQLYEEVGYPEAAAKTLLILPPGGPRDARLARLYRTLGRSADAESAFKVVLNDDAVQPQDLYAGADFYAAAGNLEFAKLFLDRMRTMSQSPALTEMLLGQYEETYGSAESAVGRLTKATELEPASPITWRALAAYQLRAGRADDALRTLDAGLAATTSGGVDATAGNLPATAPARASAGGSRDDLTSLKTVALIARRLPNAERYAMLRQLTRDPQNPAAAAALAAQADAATAVAAAGQDPAARAAAVKAARARLAELAVAYPDFWPLQRELIVQMMQGEQVAQAADAAWRAVPAFTWTPEPAQLAAEAFASLGRWDRVVDAATAWRQRSTGDPVPADVMMADALLAQRQPLLAIQRLEAHVRAAPPLSPADTTATSPASTSSTRPATALVTSPTRATTIALYRTYGRALLAAGRDADAATALAPLLAAGTDGRAAWLMLAGAHKQAATAKAWVDRAATAVGADAPVEQRLAVASAYFDAGRRTGDAGLLSRALEMVDGLAAGDALPPTAFAVRAQAAHYLGDYAKAEESWRQIRRGVANPDPDVLNNLAYVLLVRGDKKDLAEATALAGQAVAGSPDVLAYVGTLAMANARNGDRAGAIQKYRQVLAKEPDSVDALLGLAGELLRGDRAEEKAEAKRLLVQARRLLDQGTPQPPELRRQLDALGGVAETSDAGR